MRIWMFGCAMGSWHLGSSAGSWEPRWAQQTTAPTTPHRGFPVSAAPRAGALCILKSTLFNGSLSPRSRPSNVCASFPHPPAAACISPSCISTDRLSTPLPILPRHLPHPSLVGRLESHAILLGANTLALPPGDPAGTFGMVLPPSQALQGPSPICMEGELAPCASAGHGLPGQCWPDRQRPESSTASPPCPVLTCLAVLRPFPPAVPLGTEASAFSTWTGWREDRGR